MRTYFERKVFKTSNYFKYFKLAHFERLKLKSETVMNATNFIFNY